jgi:hypothetical protein
MKRLLIVLVALVAAFALVLPASAADLKFGGYFKSVFYAVDNIRDGTDGNAALGISGNDSNSSFFYTRMRLYFTAIASENLKAVSMLEVDSNWGDGRIGRVSIDGGSDGRGDAGNTDGSANSGMEVKRAAIYFNIPDTALSFNVGLTGIKLGKSGIAFNDDTPGITATYVYSPVKVTLAYSRINDASGNPGTGATPMVGNSSGDDWNMFGLDVRYKQEAFSGNFSVAYVKTASSLTSNPVTPANDDFDLGTIAIDADYKADMWNAYLTAAFNTGENESNPILGTSAGSDFAGYLITLGGNYNVNDTISVGGDFYWASGQDVTDLGNSDIDAFTTYGVIGRPSYNMDDIVFSGWFDDETSNVGTAAGGGAFLNNTTATGQTATNAGYTPTNIIAIGAHADWKPLEHTLVQPGFAWMKFAEDVFSQVDAPGAAALQVDDSLGFSLYARLNQGITDGLALKATLAYLIADDGYSALQNDDDAIKLALGLFWSW